MLGSMMNFKVLERQAPEELMDASGIEHQWTRILKSLTLSPELYQMAVVPDWRVKLLGFFLLVTFR